MYRYVLTNLVFVAAAYGYVRYKKQNVSRPVVLLAAGLFGLTMIFDAIIIGLDIVRYYPEHILGLYIANIPLEDLSYPLVAAGLIPALWKKNDQ